MFCLSLPLPSTSLCRRRADESTPSGANRTHNAMQQHSSATAAHSGSVGRRPAVTDDVNGVAIARRTRGPMVVAFGFTVKGPVAGQVPKVRVGNRHMLASTLCLLALSACASAGSAPQSVAIKELGVLNDDPVLYSPWITEHHDVRNSGQSSARYDVGSYNGTCLLTAARPVGSAFFASTGVTATNGRTAFIGRWERCDGLHPWLCVQRRAETGGKLVHKEP